MHLKFIKMRQIPFANTFATDGIKTLIGEALWNYHGAKGIGLGLDSALERVLGWKNPVTKLHLAHLVKLGREFTDWNGFTDINTIPDQAPKAAKPPISRDRRIRNSDAIAP
jgi:hypothetical protein